MRPASRSLHLLRSGTLAMVVAMALADGAQAQGTEGAPRPRAGRTMTVALPLLLDGVYLGEINARVDAQGAVAVEAERLVAMFGQRLSAEVAAAVRAHNNQGGDQGGFIGLAALVDLGISADYDSSNLQLRFSIPLSRQGTQIISSATAMGSDGTARNYMPEAPLSGSVTLALNQTYRWNGSNRGFAPVTLAGDVVLNAGGAKGVSLLAQLEYDGARDRAFNRGNVQLVHDDEPRALRYALGDVAPMTAGFQSAPLIGGLSFERQYGNIQPLRNIRPSGRLGFVLDRPATVDVVVNGTTIRTMELAAGQYNLRDFPFFNGLNQVELYVVDQVGRRLLTSFSQYYSPRLLDKGVVEFGLTAGVLETPGGIGGLGGSRYRGGAAASGFIRAGITRGLTLGLNAQAGRNQWNAGAETALATPLGTISLLGALSHTDAAGSGKAFLVSYEGAFRGNAVFSNIRFNLEAQTTSRNYTVLALNPQVNTAKASVSARVSAILPARIGLGLGFSRYYGRDREPDQTRYAVNLSRSIGRVNLSLAAERNEKTGTPVDNRGLLTLSLPLGRSRMVRGGYDTRGNLANVEVSQFQRNELGSFGLRAAATHSDDGYTGNGELSYAANRFALQLAHAAITDAQGRVTSQQSRYTLSSQIAFAGDQLAVGRPVGQRFVIVERHPTLEDAEVEIWQGAVRTRPQAAADGFGPALVSAGSAYIASQLRIDATNLPLGYDLGAGQYDLRPGLASGYAVTVGSDASRLVIGVAHDSTGAPVSLKGGALIRVGDKSGTKILLFTNRNGRFVANGVAPGDYVIVMGDNNELHGTITIPAKSKGTVMVGDIRMEGPVGPRELPVASGNPAPVAAPAPVRAPAQASAQASTPVLAGQSAPDLHRLVKGWRRVGHRRLQRELARGGVHVERRELHRLYRIVCRRLDRHQRLARSICALPHQVAQHRRPTALALRPTLAGAPR